VQSQLGIDLSANSPILEHAGKKGARVTQADFSYGAAEDKAATRSLSIFADRRYLREQLRKGRRNSSDAPPRPITAGLSFGPFYSSTISQATSRPSSRAMTAIQLISSEVALS
jgi:hypothetical protein